jgi:hypothetical protein
MVKRAIYQTASITTIPTEKGMKDLDVFHPSYRVKRITKEPISYFNPKYSKKNDKETHISDDGSVFLDIL